MYCPQCKSEYREGVTQCADCDVPLVRELPAEDPGLPPVSWDDLVPVLKSFDETELLMVRSLLEAAGIPAYMSGEEMTDVAADHLFGSPNFAGGPAELRVPADRADEANEVLKSPPAADEPEP
jgi:hypothetical protein